MVVVLLACTVACSSTTRRELPATVHLLHFAGALSLNTQISADEARRILGEVNRIWSGAHVSFVVDTVRSEEGLSDADALGWLTSSHEDAWPDAILANLARIRPPVAGAPNHLHIYFIRTLPCNGITMMPDAVFVQDTPWLKLVEGGQREPRARVLAHEIGHTFGLGHGRERDQLMFPGSTGARLSQSDLAMVAQHFQLSGAAPAP